MVDLASLEENESFPAFRNNASQYWTTKRCFDLLMQGYWFPELSESLQEDILQNSRVVSVRQNSSLYRIGDPVDGMYASLEGDLRVHVVGDTGDKVFIRSIGPASWFGDIHLLDGTPRRTFSVRAKSPASVLFLPKERYARIVETNREAYREFVRLMCIHNMFTIQMVLESRSDAPVKAARALLRLARAHGKEVADGVEIDMRLSQADLASLVGVSRQYMNELLARWQEEGVIQWNPNGRHVVSMESLNAFLTPLDSWLNRSEGWT